MNNFLPGVIAIVTTCILSGGLTYRYQANKYEAIIQEHRTLAAQTLQQELEKNLEATLKLNQKIFELETQYHESQQELTDLDTRYRQLVRNAGGLRDKGSRKCSGSSQANDTGSSKPDGTDSRVLSEETTEFLLNLTRDCDQVRLRLIEAQEWAKMMISQ